MSLPLKELRFGAPETIHLWLDIESDAVGKDVGAIAREILLDWAKKKAHAYKVATKRLRAKGLQPELFGDDLEDDGRSRSETDQRRGRG